MLSRARIFAAVTLLASCLAGPDAWAQAQNLEAGKSASQLFAGTCTACHKSPRGLLKTVSPGALPGFLREHYTTSSDMASQLASFLVSNGASDARQAKQGTDNKQQSADKPGGADQADRPGRKNRNAPSQEAARPDDAPPPAEGGRQGRRRLAHPGEPSEEVKPSAAPAQAAIERGPDGRRLKRGRPGRPGADEPSMANEPPRSEPGADDKAKGDTTAKGEPAKEDIGKKEEMGNTDRAKPDAEGKSNEAKSEPAKMEAPKDDASGEKPAARRDMQPVTPASPAAASSAPASTPAPAVASGGSSEPAASAPRPSAPQAPAPAVQEPPAVTASSPPPAPPSSGSPAPPISQ